MREDRETYESYSFMIKYEKKNQQTVYNKHDALQRIIEHSLTGYLVDSWRPEVEST